MLRRINQRTERQSLQKVCNPLIFDESQRPALLKLPKRENLSPMDRHDHASNGF
jgi:hypothetical protein